MKETTIFLFVGSALLLTTILHNPVNGIPVPEAAQNETIANSTTTDQPKMEVPTTTEQIPTTQTPELLQGTNLTKSMLEAIPGNETEVKIKATMIPATIVEVKNRTGVQSTIISKPGVSVNVSVPEEITGSVPGANLHVKEPQPGNFVTNISQVPARENETSPAPPESLETEMPATTDKKNSSEQNYVFITRQFEFIEPQHIRVGPGYQVGVPSLNPSGSLQPVQGSDIGRAGGTPVAGGAVVPPGPDGAAATVGTPFPVGSSTGGELGGGAVGGNGLEAALGQLPPQGVNYPRVEIYEGQIVQTSRGPYLLLNQIH